jgi:AcrR family transcriptional regulator
MTEGARANRPRAGNGAGDGAGRSASKKEERLSRLQLGAAARAGTLLPATLNRSRVFIPGGAPRLEQIRRVGCQLLYQYGYSGMTMRQIAAHLKIKAASLYHHFPSKQDILFDVMFDTALQLMHGLLRIEKSIDDPREKLDTAIRWHVLFHTQKREEAFVSHSELRSLTPDNLRSVMRVRKDYDTVFTAILQRCEEAGLLPRRDTAVVRNAILTMCTATAGWFNPAGPLSAEDVADQIAQFVWHGLLGVPAERSERDRESAVAKTRWLWEALQEAPPPEIKYQSDPILPLLRERKAAHLRQLEQDQSHAQE